MKRVLFISIFMILSSCVGVIEQGSKEKTKSVSDNASINFEGVADGHGISHNKILVRFKQAFGGSGNFAYHAFLNGMPQPSATVLQEDIILDSDNYINLIIDQLKFNTNYSVQIRVYDLNALVYDDNDTILKVSTLDTFVPDFDGIAAIYNLNGVDSMTKLRIVWNPAQVPVVTAGDPFSVEHSISGYNVYVSSSLEELSSLLNLSNQHTIDLTNYPNSQVLSVSTAETDATEKTVTGLNPGITYYCAVRARQSSSPPKYELNTKILSYATLTSAPVEFAGVATAEVPSTYLGFSQIDVTWLPATGAGLYQIYVKPLSSDSGTIHPFYDLQYKIKTITDLSKVSETLTSGTLIQGNTSYGVYILACKDSNCGWNGTSLNNNEVKGTNVRKIVKTVPPIAPFEEANLDSIITVTQPDGITGLSSLDVNWSDFDLTRGHYSEVKVYEVLDKDQPYKVLGSANLRLVPYNKPTPDYAYPYINPNVTSPLLVGNSPVTARLTNLTLDQEYCFIVLPYMTGNGIPDDEAFTLTESKWPDVKCLAPSYVAPTYGLSSLLPTCIPSGDGASADISWTLPESMGIVTSWEVWYRKGPGSFAFEGADGAWLNGSGIYILKMFQAEQFHTL